jgi:DNA (cytosine-5)-methyltransferase 1
MRRSTMGIWVPQGFEEEREAPQWVITDNGVAAPFHAVQRRRQPTGIDLFCGCGGFSLGVMQAGFRVLAGLDNDPAATITYLCNLGSHPVQIHYAAPEDEERLKQWLEEEISRKARESGRTVSAMLTSGSGWISHHSDIEPVRHFFFGDARKFTGEQILEALSMKRGEVDLVFGGPPCQGFSRAGRRDVMDPRNSLVFEFARLALEIWPKAMVMENVPDLVSMVTPEGVPVLDALCRVLEDGGFGAYESLKRALSATSGAGAALRTPKPKEPAPAAEKTDRPIQLAFGFGDEQ